MDKKVKRCPQCNFANDQYAFLCSNPECRESLMNVAPEAVLIKDQVPNKKEGTLPQEIDKPGKSLDGVTKRLEPMLASVNQKEFVFSVRHMGVVGREGDINVSCLENSNYISRKHAMFFFSGAGWQLEVLTDTNPTYINGVLVPKGFKHSIKDGDKITLANSSFIFREY